MNLKLHSERKPFAWPLPRKLSGLLAVSLALLAGQTAFGGPVTLQGQNKGDTNWYAGNLQNWVELDYIPCRLQFGVNLQGSQTITLYFDHLNGTVPGFVDLFNFTTSSNLVFT